MVQPMLQLFCIPDYKFVILFKARIYTNFNQNIERWKLWECEKMFYKQDPKSFWRRVIYLAKHSLTSDAWYLDFMPSLEECRLWSSGFHLEHHHQEESSLWSQLKPSQYKYHSYRTTLQCCRPNIKSRSRFSFTLGHKQELDGIGTEKLRKANYKWYLWLQLD